MFLPPTPFPSTEYFRLSVLKINMNAPVLNCLKMMGRNCKGHLLRTRECALHNKMPRDLMYPPYGMQDCKS